MSESIIAAALAVIAAEYPDTFGPEVVLESARPDDSPLHPFVFDKDEAEAAEDYYLYRARRLIQSVRVTVVTADETPRRVRAYVAIPGEVNPFVFAPVASLLADPAKATAARTEAARRLTQAQDAVEDLDAILVTSVPVKRAKRRLAEAAEALANA